MNYSVKTIPRFEKNLKKLSKKYPSLKSEYANLVKNLKENPELGTLIGHNCYKIRLAIASKGKGKSGGTRVITYFLVADDSVYLLSIYDKSDKDNLTDKELTRIIHRAKI